jgi:hypothetical protein
MNGETPMNESETTPEIPPVVDGATNAAPDPVKLRGRIEITVSLEGALNIGGEFPDISWCGDTLSRALRFIDRELIAGRVALQLTQAAQGVQIAQPGPPKGRPVPTPRWPIR